MVGSEGVATKRRPSHDVSSIIQEKMANSIRWFQNLFANGLSSRAAIFYIVLVITLMLCSGTLEREDGATATDDVMLTSNLHSKEANFNPEKYELFPNTSALLDHNKTLINEGNLFQPHDENLASVSNTTGLYTTDRINRSLVPEVNNNNLLRAGSNTTGLHTSDHGNCSWVKELSELILVITSAVEFSSGFISCAHNFLSRVFSNDGTSSTRNGTRSNAKFLRLFISILLICCRFTKVACDNTDTDLTPSCSSVNMIPQDPPIQEKCSSSQYQELFTSDGKLSTGVAPVGIPPLSRISKFTSGLKDQVHKVCPRTQLMKQLDMTIPGVIPVVQSIDFENGTSRMYDMVKMYSSKERDYKVTIEDRPQQRSQKNWPSIKLTLWASCVVIALLLLIVIPLLYPYISPHWVHAPHIEVEPSSSHVKVYPPNPVNGLSLGYISTSAPGLNTTPTSTLATYLPDKLAGDDKPTFIQNLDVKMSEEEKVENNNCEVHARQSSDACVANSEFVGIGCHRPVSIHEEKTKEDRRKMIEPSFHNTCYFEQKNVTSGAPILYDTNSDFMGFSSQQEVHY